MEFTLQLNDMLVAFSLAIIFLIPQLFTVGKHPLLTLPLALGHYLSGVYYLRELYLNYSEPNIPTYLFCSVFLIIILMIGQLFLAVGSVCIYSEDN